MIRLIETADGSNSFYNEELNETYHSKHGAFSESMHVFITNGLYAFKPFQSPIRVLEVGFGTGLNASLLYQEIMRDPELNIQYTGLEPYPLPTEMLENVLFEGIDQDVFRQIHSSYSKSLQLANGRFSMKVLQQKLESFQPEETFDLVFYDAFAPAVQPELWDLKAMQRIYNLMDKGAVWVSYCAKGEVRRNLLQVGFIVERLPGPAFKRHMLRAVKP